MRLALGRKLGATHTIDNSKTELPAQLRSLAVDGVDHVVENTGDPALYRAGFDLLKPGGSMALLTGEGRAGDVDGRTILDVIQGDAVPQEFIPHLIRYYRQGRFPYDQLLTFYDFTDINRAIADAKRGTTIKAVLRMA